MNPIIERDELKKLIDSKKIILIDVRRKNELVHGVIPTSKNIPLTELEQAFELDDNSFFQKYKFKKPTKKDHIVCYCRTGSRSHTASEILKQQRYKVQNYEGSIWDWSEIDPNVKKYFN
ncbi:hypothetical protein J4456_03505 [Candidatus Pacearchaeota archaeon]|nr:hypothetical protein [Candidatus Pacearchaeota archaeon]